MLDPKGGKKEAKNPLFEKKTRSYGIGSFLPFYARFDPRQVLLTRVRVSSLGGDIPPPQDLTRFVKWPEYVRLQRQKVILNQRLKVRLCSRPCFVFPS